MGKTRARSGQAKTERRQQILDASWQLFLENPRILPSVEAIATASQASRGAFYIYFAAREDIFLDILVDQYSSWLGDFQRRCVSLYALNPSVLTQAFCAWLFANPGFVLLACMQRTVLEPGASPGRGELARQAIRANALGVGEVICGQFTALNPLATTQSIMRAFALVIGLVQLEGLLPVAGGTELTSHAASHPGTELVIFGPECRRNLQIGLEALFRAGLNPGR